MPPSSSIMLPGRMSTPLIFMDRLPDELDGKSRATGPLAGPADWTAP
jgi:hypothetical protein